MSKIMRFLIVAFLLVSLVMIQDGGLNRTVQAAVGAANFADVQNVSTQKFAVGNPVGFASLPAANGFLIWGATDELVSPHLLTNFDQPGGSVNLPASVDGSSNAAFDAFSESIVFLDAAAAFLTQVRLNGRGYPDTNPKKTSRFDARPYGIQKPAGITFDPANRRLYILDAKGPRIVSIAPDPTKGWDGASATRENRVKKIKVSGTGDSKLKGLAFNLKNGHLYVSSPADQKVYELDSFGSAIAVMDLSRFNLPNIQALAFAPSTDQTDSPSSQYLFVLDGGTATLDGTTTKSGQIVELTIDPMALPSGTTLLPATHVRTIDTSKTAWSPSSPDPSGVDYFPSTGQLIIDDSEVDEMAVYAGANVYFSSLAGNLVSTCNTLAYSREPTGIAVNPANNHIFITDDDKKEIYEINLGPDNKYCTSDDILTKASTVTLFGGTGGDPEDIAYGENTLFIAGGADAEVWYFSLGPNGVLGGGDDGPVSHYDTLVMGFKDMEGIGYYPEAGTLFIVSTSSSDQYIGEVTVSGQLLRAYNVSFMGSAQNIRSDVGYLPSLADPSKKNIYIASRGIDNDSGVNPSPTENDGKVWEISINPPVVNTPTNTLSPTTTASPTLTSTPTKTSTSTSTSTPGPSPSATITSTSTSTPLPSPSPTLTSTATITNTPSPSATPTATPTPSSNPLYLSMASNGTIGGVAFADEDILKFDGVSWSLFFDGSDVGVGGSDLFAFDVVNANTIWMAFTSSMTLNGISVTSRDVVQFSATSLGANTAGTFSMIVRGAAVGLDANSEAIDSLSLLTDGRVLLSTTGSSVVPGVSGADEDVLAFTPISLGAATSGSWAMYFDGSDVGLADTSSEDVDALDVDSYGNIYLSTLGDFSVPGVSGADEDVFICAPSTVGDTTACNYLPNLYFDGSTWGQVSNDVDAFNLLAIGPLPSPTATSTPTNTPTSTNSPTITPTPTHTSSPTPGPSPTFTSSPTFTPTFTLTNTPTSTPVPSATSTPTDTLTATPTSQSTYGPIFISLDGGGTVGGVVAEDIDVLKYDGTSWSLFFDASDLGINTSGQDMNDFVILDANTMLLTFRTTFTLGTMAVEPYDVLKFTATSFGSNTAGTFSFYFDGNDVGLDTTSEVIDALDLLPDGRILISTTGDPVVPGVTAQDEDILAFTPATLGDLTSGTWALYFDGTAVGLGDSANEDVDGLDVTDNGDIYLSVLVDFSVPEISGLNEDVFVCTPLSLGTPTACTYHSTLYFDGSLWALDANDVDGIYIP